MLNVPNDLRIPPQTGQRSRKAFPTSSIPNWLGEGEMYQRIVMQCQECGSNNQLQIMSYQVKSQMERAVAEYFIKAI